MGTPVTSGGFMVAGLGAESSTRLDTGTVRTVTGEGYLKYMIER